MSNWDDMLDMQRREENPDYITPTISYTGADYAELVHDCGGDEDAASLIMNEVMDRDMARHDSQRIQKLERENAALRQTLEDHGIEID